MLNKYNLLTHKFTSKSQSRVELTGIYVSPKEVCATDSYMLIRVQNPKFNPKDYPLIEGEKTKILTNFKPFILPKEEAIKVLSNLPKSKQLSILNNAVILKQEKDFVEFGMTDLSSFNKVKSRTIVGTFPEYKSFLVKKGRHIKITLNPKLLKTIIEFFSQFSNEITLEIPVKKEKPIYFEGESKETNQKGQAILMPIKTKS